MLSAETDSRSSEHFLEYPESVLAVQTRQLVLGPKLMRPTNSLRILRKGSQFRLVSDLDQSVQSHPDRVPVNKPEKVYEEIHKFDLSATPLTVDISKTILNFSDLVEIKYLCDGSNSHISKATLHGAKVILKIMKAAAGVKQDALKEFTRETSLLKRFHHTNICGLVGFGRSTDTINKFTAPNEKLISTALLPFIVLERLNGGTLTAKLNKTRTGFSKPFSLSTFYNYAKQLISALVYLHSGFSANAAVIHRDLKPDNIGFTDSGVLKLMDFGLSICIPKGNNDNEQYELTGKLNLF